MKYTTKILESEAEYIQANERVSELMDMEFELGSEINHEIQLLVFLINDYQNKHYLLEPVDPITHIKIRMEELGL